MKVRKENGIDYIFTPNVIDQINEFVNDTLYEGLISGFDIRDAEEFDEVIEAAENGQTEFELNVDLEQMADPDVFENVLSYFMDNHIFDQEYRYTTGLKITVDKESNALEVSAGLVLRSYSGLMPNIDLSWQSKFFEDVEKLLDAPLFVKAYKNSENDYAIGETVIDGVKYECSLVSVNDQEEPEFYIGVKFTKSKGSLQINSGITTGWRNYSDLSKVFSEISEQL